MSDNITAIHPSWEIIHGDALKLLGQFAPFVFFPAFLPALAWYGARAVSSLKYTFFV